MDLVLLVAALIVLLGLNAFFVLAEFAIVRVRKSRVDELVAEGDPRARTLEAVQARLDDALNVCQIGITLASVALGIVSKHLADAIIGDADHDFLRYSLALGGAYVLVSGAHIVLGEQVPKLAAIRIADRAALFCAAPLRYTRLVLFPALWLLGLLSRATLRLIGLRRAPEELHSEEELRIILDRSQERGLMSFRRLLFLENVFDLGTLAAGDAMNPRESVRCLDPGLPWEENLRQVRASHFTRYPLLHSGADRPVGFIHMKDLVLRAGDGWPDLASLVRPILSVSESTPLEAVLADMQRRRIHAALVTDDQGRWTGFITLEDVLEELVGTIRDEFEEEEPVRLADLLSPERIFLDIEAPTSIAAVQAALGRLPSTALPLPAEQISRAVEARERVLGTYLGQGIGMPHARLAGLRQPFLMVIRSPGGVRLEGTPDLAYLLLVLLTPAGQPRIHQRIQARVATLLHESDYVRERLTTAESADEVIEVIRTGEQAAID